MKKGIYILVIALGLIPSFFALLHAEAGSLDTDTELAREMRKANDAWRKLRPQVRDPANNHSSIELVAIVEQCMKRALELTPAMTADLESGDRDKFIQAYRKQMKEVLALLPELASALKAGDNASAQTLVKRIGKLEKDGHTDFRRPDM